MRQRLFRTGRYSISQTQNEEKLVEKGPNEDHGIDTAASATEMKDEELAMVTGGKGLWKRVGTCQEH